MEGRLRKRIKRTNGIWQVSTNNNNNNNPNNNDGEIPGPSSACSRQSKLQSQKTIPPPRAIKINTKSDNECQVNPYSPSAEKALSIILIQDKIISFLDLPGLKTVRLVCRSWLMSTLRRLGHLSRLELTPQTMNEQLDIFQASPPSCKPPISVFIFSGGIILSESLVLRFVSLFGEQVKELSIISCNVTRSAVPTLFSQVQLLLSNNKLPQLRKLTLDSTFLRYEWTDYLTTTPPLHLPSLLHLKFLPDDLGQYSQYRLHSMGHDIFMASPNLIYFENPPLRTDNLCVGQNPDPDSWSFKFPCVRSCVIPEKDLAHPEMQVFAQSHPKLKQLKILSAAHTPFNNNNNNYDNNGVASIPQKLQYLLQLLENSKDSLVEFEPIPQLFQLPHPSISWPILSHVKILRLCLHAQHNLNYYFQEKQLLLHSSSTEFQDLLPNLQKISFVLDLNNFSLWEKYKKLPPGFSNNFPLVHELEILGVFQWKTWDRRNWEILSNGNGNGKGNVIGWARKHMACSCTWFQRLADLFPNVTTIKLWSCTKLHENDNLKGFLKVYPRLKSLSLDIPIGQKLEPGKDGSCSSSVCDTREVRELRLRGYCTALLTQVEQMKELQKLELILSAKNYLSLPAECPISQMKVMQLKTNNPGLQILIRYHKYHYGAFNLRKLLQPLANLAHFAHIPPDFDV